MPLSDYEASEQAYLQEITQTDLVGPWLREQVKDSPHSGNTIFVHPGLIMFIDWGGGRAVDSGEYLVSSGFGQDFLEVRSRKAMPLYERMAGESGQNYLGLHYSMGASPMVLAQCLAAAEKASRETGTHIRYSPIMAEPHDFAKVGKFVDLDNPHLGNIICIISSDFAFLRPGVTSYPEWFLRHPKVHLVYADDMGVSWSHFSFLGQVRKQTDNPDEEHVRARHLLDTVASTLLLDLKPGEVKAILDYCMVMYAMEDRREIVDIWVDSVRPGGFIDRIRSECSLSDTSTTRMN